MAAKAPCFLQYSLPWHAKEHLLCPLHPPRPEPGTGSPLQPLFWSFTTTHWPCCAWASPWASSSRQPSTSISSMKDRITPSSFSCCSSLNSMSLLMSWPFSYSSPTWSRKRAASIWFCVHRCCHRLFVFVNRSVHSNMVSGPTSIKFLFYPFAVSQC